MAVPIGQRIGDYEVLDLLGAGGMGQVYRVRNVISERIEAMKILLPNLALEPEFATRFTTEIRTLAALEHPNIAQLRTAFQCNNQLVMVMEYVEGVTLEQRARQGALSLDEVLDGLSQTLAALSYAHSRGVVHRDIKPANMMATSHGVIKLMDFGIARSVTDIHLTVPGTTIGSLYYVSPEQVRGQAVDARSDLYSVGITLYELSTGSRPFQADTAYTVLEQQLNSVPRPPIELNPELPHLLNEIILTALAKDPDQRFQSADAFRSALRTVIPAAVAEKSRIQQQPAPAWERVPTLPAVATGQVARSEPSYSGDSLPQPRSAVPSQGRGSHRGLWMGLGATAALATLVLAATSIPRFVKARADSHVSVPLRQTTEPTSARAREAMPGTTDQASPGVGAVTRTDAPAKNDNASIGNGITRPAVKDRSWKHAGGPPGQLDGGKQPPLLLPDTSASTERIGRVQQDTDATSERLTQLSSRADAAQISIQQLQRQQESAGLGLRGDIGASLGRMNSYMRNATSDLHRGDLMEANGEMDKAERELNRLEAFLGS